ncbi:ABC transporter substrate-binding protein [Paenibacillus contaminans]|uniref:Iron-siderophore ABC transporter substrate-binding protein n=1 Tax=Paenibacillus contaminans TaxID=450362 RepID=A0A329M0P0_9BACL|nr:iron-siderophore ABC transporter substrate-binding protein [Paenibacillus contaminans]RAV13775.1 iron-siderophore ABC transporter substrate-binding protein [Paenibacillus contaminans]
MQLFRKPLALLLSLVLISLLAACGKSATETPSPEPSPTQNAARTITHAMGSTPITGTPQRIVVLTTQGTETLLELGIQPVGAVKSWIGNPWYDHIKDRMNGVQVVGDETQPNMELIASLKPDLILGTKVRQEKIYDQLTAIAPTVFTENLGDSMLENFELYTKALNKETEGKAVLDQFNKLIADTKAKLGDKTKLQISMARFQPDKVRVYLKQNFAGVVLEKLGFARPESQNKKEFTLDIVKEQLPMLDGDVLFYFTSDRDGATAATDLAKSWFKDPLAQNMNVVKSNRIFNVDEAIWNSAGGMMAAKLLVKDIEKIVTGL